MTTDPFTEAAAAKAEQWWPKQRHGVFVNPSLIRKEMVRMAVWARTHLAAQEPTDAEVLESAARDLPMDCYDPRHMADWLRARARAARRDDTSPTPEQRIRDLHAPDADGNCGHCTRGRVYPVPAPCETVRALAGGGEAR